MNFNCKKITSIYKCGICSNIPICCILFYYTLNFLHLLKFYNKYDKIKFGYVRCPICRIRNKFVSIIKCGNIKVKNYKIKEYLATVYSKLDEIIPKKYKNKKINYIQLVFDEESLKIQIEKNYTTLGEKFNE